MQTEKEVFKFSDEDLKRLRRSLSKGSESFLFNIYRFPLMPNQMRHTNKRRHPNLYETLNEVKKAFEASLFSAQEFSEILKLLDLKNTKEQINKKKVSLSLKPYSQKQASIWANSWDTKLKMKIKK